MNNNDFYSNLDKIRKLYLKQNYEEAVKIADKMDFKRLKDWKYIAMLINLYESVGKLEDVRYFCILAYNRNLGGKKLLYKLTKVTIRLEEIDEAEELYDEYVQMPGRDSKKYELLYELKAVQGAKKAELIKILEDYMKRDLDEKYAYTLAELYAKTKQNEKCLNFCTRIIERFEAGDVVDKAQALKASILNPAQNNGAGTRPSRVNAKAGNTAPLAQGQGVPQNVSVGSNTIGINVEQIMSETGNQVYAPNGNFNTTQSIMMQDIFATQDIPAQQDMYATQNIPAQQDMYATQSIPQQNLEATQVIPAQQEFNATQTIPVQQNLEDTQVVNLQQNLGATQVIPAVTEQDEKTPSLDEKKNEEIKQVKETAATEELQEEKEEARQPVETVAEKVEKPEPVSEQNTVTESTVRVDTEAINSALQEAAATMDRSVLRTDGTQDMEDVFQSIIKILGA